MDNIFNKILKAAIIAVVCLTMCGCSAKRDVIFYGEYVDTSGKTNAAYLKSYLIMDCCEEWDEFVDFARHIKGASAVEGFEYHLYDENGEEVPLKEDITVTFHPTDDFLSKDGELVVCSYPNGYMYQVTPGSDGDVVFNTKESGIFLAVKKGSESLWISNLPDCTGQCRTCSDEW